MRASHVVRIKSICSLRKELPRCLLFALALGACSSSEEDPVPVCGPDTGVAPEHLACTGLYSDYRTKTISPEARPYTPGISFWSDGYEKSRFLMLPPGATIDATNVDEWSFPVGTKVWKEFRAGGRKIETRLLWKASPERWVRTAYLWSEDGKSATLGLGRSFEVMGLPYDVPSEAQCDECHSGRKDALLGVEALALALPTATGVTLASLVAEGRIAPSPPATSVSLEAGPGVLHMNCGVSCHNGSPGALAADGSTRLRIAFLEATTKPQSTWELTTTTVGVPTTLPGWAGEPRIAAGAPEASVIVKAMSTQGTGQMPPSTKQIDFDGIAAVESWIRTLPK